MSGGERSFFKVLGPGLLFAGAAVGVSHLVQSTRAGAVYGLSLLFVVVLANVLKYPAFSFGPRYAAATGTSLLEGYRRQGRWALVLYAVITFGTMFTVQAAVTFVTAALAVAWLGIDVAPTIVGAAILLVCAVIVGVGQYRWLDRIMKVVVVLLTLLTIAATLLVLPRVSWVGLWPTGDAWADPKTLMFIAALVGWMPSAIDISVWHSLWTLARRRDSSYAPSVRESLLDFNIGYIGTALLAVCFLLLGAGVIYGHGVDIPRPAHKFAELVLALYTETLGDWSRPLIGACAFMVMFSTTLTVVDGFPRALAALYQRFRSPEDPTSIDSPSRVPYWIAVVVLGVGSVVLLQFFLKRLTDLVDLATTLSFLTAPVLATLNHRAVMSAEVATADRPSRPMEVYSMVCIIFLAAFALYYIVLRFGS